MTRNTGPCPTCGRIHVTTEELEGARAAMAAAGERLRRVAESTELARSEFRVASREYRKASRKYGRAYDKWTGRDQA